MANEKQDRILKEVRRDGVAILICEPFSDTDQFVSYPEGICERRLEF